MKRAISAAFPLNWQTRLVRLLWICMRKKCILCEYYPMGVSFFDLLQHGNKYVRLSSLRGTACSTIIFALTARKHAKPSHSCMINHARSGNARRFWANKKNSFHHSWPRIGPKLRAIFRQWNTIMLRIIRYEDNGI